MLWVILYACGVLPAFVVAARWYARQPVNLYDDASELRPAAALMVALLWPLLAAVLGAVVGVDRLYRLATRGVPDASR